MGATSEPQQGELNVSRSMATENSPIAYGSGSFGPESLFKVFAGFYVFYYTDKRRPWLLAGLPFYIGFREPVLNY